ncbi:MAG: porin [Candidatus Fermentibacteria bacterium]|nr:porin [Candidatus Fermentibacteria bacterium]
MKRTLVVLAVFALVAFAGDMISGGSELTKFTGHASFRYSMNGFEDINPSSTMGTYSYVSWVPKLNEYVDGKIGATITTPSATNFNVCYAYLNLHFTDNFTLSGGQMNIPFGYAYTRSSGSMLFADRSMIVSGDDFGAYGGKDNMAMLTAEFAPVTVDLALSNGDGMRNSADTTVNKQFTARLAVDPAEWLTIGGSMAMIGAPEVTVEEVTTESWSSNGMDFFAVANYPVTSTGTLNFVGEYMMLAAYDVENAHDGASMSAMLAYDAQLNGDVIKAVQPAVRFDTIDPIDLTGNDELEDNSTVLDFCVGIEVFSNKNTFQIGARNYGFENEDIDGYTDIYAKWRMNF